MQQNCIAPREMLMPQHRLKRPSVPNPPTRAAPATLAVFRKSLRVEKISEGVFESCDFIVTQVPILPRHATDLLTGAYQLSSTLITVLVVRSSGDEQYSQDC
jgi:hypothetical protein